MKVVRHAYSGCVRKGVKREGGGGGRWRRGDGGESRECVLIPALSAAETNCVGVCVGVGGYVTSLCEGVLKQVLFTIYEHQLHLCM